MLAEFAVFDATQHGVQFVQLSLFDVHIAEERAGKRLELLCRFHEPLQHGVRVNLKHPGRGAYAQAFGQARQYTDQQLHRNPLAVKERTVRLQKASFTSATVPLSPQATAGMAMRAEVPQPQPALIITARMGTKMPRS